MHTAPDAGERSAL